MNILDTIIEYKREEVKSRKLKVKTAELEKRELFSRTVLPLKDFLLLTSSLLYSIIVSRIFITAGLLVYPNSFLLFRFPGFQLLR